MSHTERLVEGIILIILSCVSIFGHLLLWIVILRKCGLRESAYYVILILSSADLILSVLCMPVTAYNIFAGDWMLSTTVCSVIGFITMVTFVAKVMSLGIIGIECYVKLCKIFIYPKIYKPRNILLMSFGVWSYSIMVAVPPFLGWGKYTLLPSLSLCFLDWKQSASYSLFVYFICFSGPCCIMIFCYYNIIILVRRRGIQLFARREFDHSLRRLSSESGNEMNKQRRLSIIYPCSHKKNKEPVASEDMDSSCERCLARRQMHKKRQEDYKLATSIMLVVLTFIMCWLPIAINMLMVIFSDIELPRFMTMFALLLGFSNSTVNVFIYGFMNAPVKHGFITILRRILFMGTLPESEASSFY